MKKYVFLLMLLLGLSGNALSQSLFNEIKKNAAAAIEKGPNPMIKEINQFKIDALDYLLIKMHEQMPDSTTEYLDKQAYAMNNYINYYLQTIIDNQNMPQAYQNKIIQLFIDISISNPLFKDTETEITHAYIENSSIMKFSLNTDWRIAAAAIYIEIKKIKTN